jgi:hypothetical protein
MAADIGGSQTDAFTSGLAHQVNPGRSNLASITLGTDAGLDQTSQHWDSMSPRGVLRTTVGAGSQDDGAYQDYMRGQTAYQPGSFEKMTDTLTQGSDETTA